MHINTLVWDSEFLGKNVGILQLGSITCPVLNEKDLVFDLFYLFANTTFKLPIVPAFASNNAHMFYLVAS